MTPFFGADSSARQVGISVEQALGLNCLLGMLVSETQRTTSHCVGMFSLGHNHVIFVTSRRGKHKLQG